MIDAQAPGVARRLRQIDGMALAGDNWQAALLDRLARLHLLTEGYRRLSSLAADVAENVRSTIGFPVDLGDGATSYDHANAQAMAYLGIPVFACTPDLFP